MQMKLIFYFPIYKFISGMYIMVAVVFMKYFLALSWFGSILPTIASKSWKSLVVL